MLSYTLYQVIFHPSKLNKKVTVLPIPGLNPNYD